MKRFITTVALLLAVAFCYGQERTNRAKLSFCNEGTVLTNIMGWAYNDRIGEWVSCLNRLESDKEQVHVKSLKEYYMSRIFNNIISLQIKTTICNDTPYYVVVWEKWDGEYKYPHIYEEWEKWRTKYFLMLTKENMDQLRNLANKPIVIDVSTLKKSRYELHIDDVDIIQSEMSHSYHSKISLIIYKATDGSIRFMFEDFHYYDNDHEKKVAKISKKYFEISDYEFQQFINVNF